MDEIIVVCASRLEESTQFAREFDVPRSTADRAEAIRDPDADSVIVGIPNHMQKKQF